VPALWPATICLAHLGGILKVRKNTRVDKLRGRLRQALGEIDIERMTTNARRRYLSNRLRELDRLIEVTVYQHVQDHPTSSSWELSSDESDLWEEVMDLHYLEASRQAIWQTLDDLNRATYESWPTPEHRLGSAKGVDVGGSVDDR
jgi:hypothetical protein